LASLIFEMKIYPKYPFMAHFYSKGFNLGNGLDT